ncbi:MAG: hypothetical protein WCG25_07045 [bacterium]
MILNIVYKAQNHVILVNNDIADITYKTICNIPGNRKYHHTNAIMAINNLIKRS